MWRATAGTAYTVNILVASISLLLAIKFLRLLGNWISNLGGKTLNLNIRQS